MGRGNAESARPPLPAGNLTSAPDSSRTKASPRSHRAVPPSEMTGPGQTEDAIPIGDSTTIQWGIQISGPLGLTAPLSRPRCAPFESLCIVFVQGDGDNEEAFD